MFAIAGRRFFWLFRSSPPVSRRCQPVPGRPEADQGELVEVGGQKKLLQWTVPGLAHAFTFWGFTILFLTIIEPMAASSSATFTSADRHTASSVPGGLLHRGRAGVAVCLRGIRVKNPPSGEPPIPVLRLPHRRGLAGPGHDRRRDDLAPLLRAAQVNTGNFPYGGGPSPPTGWPTRSSPRTGVNSVIETVPPGQHHHHHRILSSSLLEAPPHLPGPHQRGHLRRPRASVHGLHPDMSMEGVATMTRWCSAPGASKTSRGSSSSTWPPARSAAGASPVPAWNTGKPLSPSS